MRRFHVAVAAGLLTAAGITVALSAGMFSTLPIVGSASFCASTVTGAGSLGGITGAGQSTTGSICAQTVPAGPTIVNGNEIIPADTQLVGSPYQTVGLSLGSLNAYPYVFQSTASNVNLAMIMSNKQGGLIVDSTATINAMSIQLPPNPIDGQQFWLTSDRTISTLLISPATGQNMAANSTASALTVSTSASYGYKWIWNATQALWYRLQ